MGRCSPLGSLHRTLPLPWTLYRRLYTRGFWGDRDFLLIDTGGLMSDAEKLPKEQQASLGFHVSSGFFSRVG